MTYAEKLRDPRWQKKRLQIFNRDKFTCKLCKDTETTLQVHHLEYHGEPWETPNKHLITLCEHCHHEVEKIKKNNAKFNFSTISIEKMLFNDNSRLMFIVHNYELIQRIYNDGSKFLAGYNFGGRFDSGIVELKKLLKKL